MRKALLAAIIFSSLVVFQSCFLLKNRKNRAIYDPFTPFMYGFVTDDMIEEGEKLRAQYPDEDFMYNRITQTYTFDVDIDLLKSEAKEKSKKNTKKSSGSSSKKKSKDKKKKKKKKEPSVIVVTESNLSKVVDDLLEDIETPTWPKSGVTVVEKNQVDITALDDNMRYQHAIFFNGAEGISGVTATYAGEDNTQFIVPTVVRNYEDNGIFHGDVKVALMALPTYVVGNSVQLNYSRYFNDYRYLTSVYLPEDHRVKEKVVTFELPEGLDIEIIEMNFDGYEITRTEGAPPKPEKKKKSSRSKKSKKTKKEPTTRKKRKDKTKTKTTKTINYIIKNTAPMGNEPASYGHSHTVPHLLVMCKSYTNGKDTIPLMGNTGDLYSWYSQLAGKMENDNSKLKEIAQDIVKDIESDEERIAAIFYWVQDNIRYLAFEDGIAAFKPDECQNVYNKRFGDCKGMANLTKEMLKTLGYDARLTWIGTERIAYDGTTPSLSSANHMICMVYTDSVNKKRYFLDPTEKYVSFGDYAQRIQGRKVVVENGDSYIVDSIPVYNYDHNKIVRTENYTIDGKLLKGDVKRVYNGESKTLVLRSYNSVGTEKRERALRSFLTNRDDYNLEAANMQHTDFGMRSQPFEISYNLTVKNHVLSNGNKLYVNLEWDRDWANYTLDTARYTHYTYQHKKHLVKTSTLAVPAGYSVSSLPQPVEVVNEYFIFRAAYKQQGNSIVYTKEIIMPKGHLHRKQVKAWNQAVLQLTNFYDSYIVLTK